MLNREKVFQKPNNNILMHGVTYEDEILEENFKILRDFDKFFVPIVKRIDLSEFKTDIPYSGGINPDLSAINNLYGLAIEYYQIRMVLFGMVILFL